eukprot:Opistho-2@12765
MDLRDEDENIRFRMPPPVRTDEFGKEVREVAWNDYDTQLKDAIRHRQGDLRAVYASRQKALDELKKLRSSRRSAKEMISKIEKERDKAVATRNRLREAVGARAVPFICN